MPFERFVMTLLLATGAMAQTTGAPIARQTNFPPVGLASSETAQVNVVNLAAAASCKGSISFFNASGAAIGSAAPFTIATGQIFSASLPFSAAGASGARAVIRGLVTLTDATCAVASSLETFDTTTGVTHVFHAAGAAPPRGFGPGIGFPR
jgi:hypothetical protein